MLKPKITKLGDSNIAGLGGEADKALRMAAGSGEKAWEGAGLEPGLHIWRIEKFKVVGVPRDQHGRFYGGDSYIVLHTYRKRPDAPSLMHDLHFWRARVLASRSPPLLVAVAAAAAGCRCCRRRLLPLPPPRPRRASPPHARALTRAGAAPAGWDRRRRRTRRARRPTNRLSLMTT